MVVLCAHRAWSNGGLLETTEHFNFQSLPSLLSGFMLIIFYPLVTIRVLFHQPILYSIVSFDELTNVWGTF